MKDSGNKYAIALTLQSKDGTTEVLKPGSTILYLLDPAIVTSVPVFNSRHNVAFSLIEDLSLSEWTLEFCVNMSKLGKKVGELNNQALLMVQAVWANRTGRFILVLVMPPLKETVCR